ncbi:MAG: TIGR00730 family Rossman fold protein [Oscillospiraceae bacterium]|nr:TIGR00730 family Rossman fold protein [Oscillospiraceae bacterium]
MKICVFAASCDVGEDYSKAVYALGRKLGAEGHTLVFGAYGGGLMGNVADGFHDAGARIIGVVPRFLEEKTENYPHLDEIIRTEELSDRKDRMIELSDRFIAVPGGIGTLDELFSILAMKASDRLDAEIVIYNVNGFFDGLLDCLRMMESGGFLYSELEELYRVETPETLGL